MDYPELETDFSLELEPTIWEGLDTWLTEQEGN
jgi:hypothetical protein